MMSGQVALWVGRFFHMHGVVSVGPEVFTMGLDWWKEIAGLYVVNARAMGTDAKPNEYTVQKKSRVY